MDCVGRRIGGRKKMTKKNTEVYSMLYDYYGTLLTARQREVFEFYYEENFSLSEIASDLGVSRQAVHISLNKARQDLDEYEEKLGLIAKHAEYEMVLHRVDIMTDAVLKDKDRMESLDSGVVKDLRKIKKLIKGLDI